MAYPMIVQGADEHQYSVTDQFTKHLTPNETTTPDTEYKTSYTNGSYEGSQGNTAVSDVGSKNATLDNKYGVYEKNNSGADQSDQVVSRYSKVSPDKSSKQQYKGVEDVSSADKVKQSGVSPRIYRVPQKVMIGIGVALTSLVVGVIVVCIIFGALIAGMRSDLDKMREDNKQLREEVSNLTELLENSDTQTSQSEMNALKDSVTNAELNIASLSEENERLSGRLNEVNGTAEAAQTLADTLATNLTIAEEAIDELETELKLIQFDINNVENDLSSAQNDIASLEIRVEGLENP